MRFSPHHCPDWCEPAPGAGQAGARQPGAPRARARQPASVPRLVGGSARPCGGSCGAARSPGRGSPHHCPACASKLPALHRQVRGSPQSPEGRCEAARITAQAGASQSAALRARCEADPPKTEVHQSCPCKDYNSSHYNLSIDFTYYLRAIAKRW